MFVVFLLSLIMVGVVSGLAGAATFLLGQGFWIGFVIAAAIQLLFGPVINRIFTIKENRIAVDAISAQAEDKLAQAKQSVELSCAFCKEVSRVNIDLSTDNSFKCAKCNNINKVIMQFSTVRTTNVIDQSVLPQQTEIVTPQE